MSRRKKAIALVLIVTTMAVVIMCISPWLPVKENSFAYFDRYHGVDRETVTAVGEAYGVAPGDFPEYGSDPFPVNYIVKELGLDRPEHSVVYRSDVDSAVKGYVSRCDTTDIGTYYLFYTDWLSPRTLSHGEALVMVVIYELDVARPGMRDDQVVASIAMRFISDSGGPDWEKVAVKCDPPARYEGKCIFMWAGTCLATK